MPEMPEMPVSPFFGGAQNLPSDVPVAATAAPVAAPTAPAAAVPAVEARAFSFAYPGAQAGVGPLDWRVEEGAFQLLMGATGSGKTTLLRCCKPSIAPAGEGAGALEVFGRSVDGLDARGAAALVGYVSQSPENQLVCDSVWHELAFGLENLGTPQNLMRRRVAEVAHFFGIEPWFRRPVAELSGGQKQMVTLASVLAMQPRLLLLDEPTAQLDPVAEKNFLHALFRVNRELGITVVVATHAPESMLDYATEAVELKAGHIEQAACHPARGTAGCHPEHVERADAGRHPAQAERARAECHPERSGVSREVEGSRAAPAVALPADASPAIVLRDAYVRYGREDDWVLRGCDLAVRAGSVHALVGGNGCGKSTLLGLAAGVLKPERGRVENRLAVSQALLPQDPKALFVCDTVADELREWQPSCGFSDADVNALLARFNLAERAGNHPYDLSGGQQQLLAFAKLLLTQPLLLLLDEPTKGLDAPSKCVVARAIADAARAGAAVLMATHDLAFAALVADEATMLFDGEAACTEPAQAFFADNLFYRPVHDAFTRLWTGEGA